MTQFSPEAAERIARATRGWESRGGTQSPHPERASINSREPVFVRVTGAISGGHYPAVITWWSAIDSAWQDAEGIVRVRVEDESEIHPGFRYPAILQGVNLSGELIAVVWGPDAFYTSAEILGKGLVNIKAQGFKGEKRFIDRPIMEKGVAVTIAEGTEWWIARHVANVLRIGRISGSYPDDDLATHPAAFLTLGGQFGVASPGGANISTPGSGEGAAYLQGGATPSLTILNNTSGFIASTVGAQCYAGGDVTIGLTLTSPNPFFYVKNSTDFSTQNGISTDDYLGSGSKVRGGIIVSGGSAPGLSDGDKGDITVSGSGTVWTVDSVDGGTW